MDDAAIMGWAHPGYPPPIRALQRRLSPSGAARVDTGPGWWPLLQRLDTELREIDPGYRLTRVGESFGELVFDAVAEVAPPARDVFERAIGTAWDESSRTCEACGRRATLWRQEDWFVTLCVEHARTRGAQLPGTEETFDDIVARPPTPPAVACLSASTVTPASVMDARAWAEERMLERDERVRRWLNIGDMAWRLRVTPDTMRQLRQAGRVCASLGPDRRLRFPIWQLAPGGGLLRGLTEVLSAVGAGVDAVALTDDVTAASGALEGVSVVQWLAGGGDVDAALRLIRGAGRG